LYIKPDSTIISDCWAAYNNIKDLTTSEGFQMYDHYTVNHLTNFVDPVTGACTNGIEGLWA
jgi:hypothetical protein